MKNKWTTTILRVPKFSGSFLANVELGELVFLFDRLTLVVQPKPLSHVDPHRNTNLIWAAASNEKLIGARDAVIFRPQLINQGLSMVHFVFSRIDPETSVENERYVCLKCGWSEASKQAFVRSHLRVYHRLLDQLYHKSVRAREVSFCCAVVLI